MRINQFVASASGLSRRAADSAIAAGRVQAAGQPATLGQTIEPGTSVTLDGLPLAPKTTFMYVMLNKPAGYVSSSARQGTAPTLYELLPTEFANLRIAGRLDLDSSGLVLLSDDGAFIQKQAHPSSGKTKEYELTLETPFKSADLPKLESGVPLADGPSNAKVLKSRGATLTVTLEEGRNRQLRRTFGALGYRITRLHRTRIGAFQLGTLEPGRWQTFEPREQK